LVNHAKVGGVYDKGKGALVLLDVETKDESGQVVLFNQFSLFVRGIGGFGGAKQPPQPSNEAPVRPPDVVHRESTAPSQAILYRLSGDTNPLHIDPAMAAMGGFNQPILHGLCSFGYAVRAVLRHFANNDASLFKSVRVRFVKHVFPGETLITEMWKVSPTTIVFRVKVAERGEYVLSNAAVELHGPAQSAQEAAPAVPVSTTPFAADAVFAELTKRVNKDLVSKINATYRFDITKDSVKRHFLVDVKNDNGKVAEVTAAQAADCTIGIKDDDFVLLMQGKLNAQKAFMGGQLSVKGNMALAQKLRLLAGAPSKL